MDVDFTNIKHEPELQIDDIHENCDDLDDYNQNHIAVKSENEEYFEIKYLTDSVGDSGDSEQDGKSTKHLRNYCSYCDKTFKSVNVDHYLKFHKDEDDGKFVFVCPSCGDEYDEKKLWTQHCAEAHDFENPSSLSMVLVDDDCSLNTNFQCLKCSATIEGSKTRELLNHASTHMSHKMYKCRHCGERFVKHKHIRAHVCVQLMGISKLNIVRRNYTKLFNKEKTRVLPHFLVACPICGLEFENHETWKVHVIAEYALNQIENINFDITLDAIGANNKTHFKCRICEKIITEKYLNTLTCHAFSHMPFKLYKCRSCKREFTAYRKYSCYCQKESRYTLTMGPYKNCTLQCTKCSEPFEDGNQLNIHFKTKHNIRRPEDLNFKVVRQNYPRSPKYICTICKRKPDIYKEYTKMFVHAAFHDKLKMYKCNLCQLTYKSKQLFMRHEAVCEARTVVRSSHKKHLKSEHTNSTITKSKSRRSYTHYCPICNINLKTPDAFMQHINENYNMNRLEGLAMKIVVIQDKKFDTTGSRKVYECLDCGSQLRDSGSYRERLDHRFSHLPYKAYECNICKKRFRKKTPLYLHYKFCDENTEETGAVAELPPSTLVSPLGENRDTEATLFEQISFACPECNLSLATKNDWDSHIESTHSFFTDIELHFKKIDGRIQCTVCNVMVENITKSKHRHRLQHMPFRSFICALCDHRSTTFYVLIGHIRRMHFTLGAFKCSMCSLVLETSYQRIVHAKDAHSPDEYPPYFCAICCAVDFSRESTLKSHVELHDLNQKEYKCLICDKMYRTAVLFVNHMRTHSKVPVVPVVTKRKQYEYNTINMISLKRYRARCHPVKETDGEDVKPVVKKRKRGQPKKSLAINSKMDLETEEKTEDSSEPLVSAASPSDIKDVLQPIGTKRTRGKARKLQSESSDDGEAAKPVVEKRKRGPPKKSLVIKSERNLETNQSKADLNNYEYFIKEENDDD